MARCRVFLAVSLASCLATAPALAQTQRPPAVTAPATVSTGEGGASWVRPAQFPLDGRETPGVGTLGRDLGRVFGDGDNLKWLAAIGAVALAGHTLDGAAKDGANAHFSPARFDAGNIGGGMLAQGGVALGAWALGTATGSPRLVAVGGDLVRAQLVTQTIVQGVKFTAGRTRPDGSNRLSFPSGHTASSFATATVLQRHFGWKVGVPAYAFGAYVGAARVAHDKHYLSDVLMGAGIGLVAGRAVTVGVGRQRFDMSVAPTVGGAAVTFTAK